MAFFCRGRGSRDQWNLTCRIVGALVGCADKVVCAGVFARGVLIGCAAADHICDGFQQADPESRGIAGSLRWVTLGKSRKQDKQRGQQDGTAARQGVMIIANSELRGRF